MSAGYNVDPEMLANAARDVREYPADQLANPLSAVEQVDLTAADFGKAAGHQAKYGAFKEGMQTVAKSVRSYITASENYAGSLTGAGTAYSANERQTAEDVQNVGSM